MNKDKKLNILFFIIIILVIGFFANKINKYLDAKITYDNLECADRAYMIYKNYDNQSADFRDKDWSLRNQDCTETEIKYKQRF